MSARTPSRSHQDALADYLDELLHDDAAPVDNPPQPIDDVAAKPESAPEAAQTDLPDATHWSDVSAQDQPEPEPEPEPGVALPCGRVRPDDDRYYLFAVGGLNLALPARRVSAELAADAEFKVAGGGPVGSTALASGKLIPVLDIARLILPPTAPTLRQPLAERASTLVLLDDQEWALATEGSGRLEELDVERVCWRGDQSARVWLAGTVAERRLALLDVDALAGMLP